MSKMVLAKVLTFCIVFIESKLSLVVKCDTFIPQERKMLSIELRYIIRLKMLFKSQKW